MTPGARQALGVGLAVVSLLAATMLQAQLGRSEKEAQFSRAADDAKERVRSLQQAIRADVDRLLRTALSAATVPALRRLVEAYDPATVADFFLTEDEWKPYRADAMMSGLWAGGAVVVRTSSMGPTTEQLKDVVAAADVAGKADLTWAADALWAVASVRLPQVVRGDGPRELVVVVARPVPLEVLSSPWVMTTGQRVLGKRGSDTELSPLLAAVGHEKDAPQPAGEGAAASAELMPGVYLWTSAPAAPLAASTGRTAGIFGAGLVLAALALVFGFRHSSAEAVTAVASLSTRNTDPAYERTAMSLPAATPGAGAPGALPAQPSRYEVAMQLGEGGMARVFLAVSRGAEGFKRTFVLKRLRPELLGVPEAVTQFIDEARLGSQLVHSNIVPVFDFGRDEQGYYLAQEYILGRDLDQVRKASLDQRRQPLEARVVLYVAREALRALGYLHTRTDETGAPAGLVHRDVSPNNLMISARGELKLLDLGIAKSTANLTRTQAGVVKGNVFYMSPEQARGEPVDARSDLFSLGLALFNASTGDTLYGGASNYELLNRAANGLSAADWTRVRALPTALATVLERALQANMEDRFPTAEAFAEAIELSAIGTVQDMQALMQGLFAADFRKEEETLLQATRGP